MHIYIYIPYAIWFRNTSSTAQGGGGSFKNRKPIGEACCCGAKMAERTHWWIERRLCVSAFLFFSFSCSLSLSLGIYLQSYLASTHAGLQRMLRHAINELRMRYSTRTNPWVLPDKKRISMRTCSSMDFETTIRLHKLSINLSIYRPIYLSMYLSISPCIDLCIYRCIYLSLYLSIYQCNVAWGSVI